MSFQTSQRIRFERPQLPELTQQFAVVDMHFHSELSDGHDSIEDIAQRALELGIGIAVTDHNSIHGAVEIDRFKSVFSIPGIELTSYEGTHLLVYFYDVKSLLRFYSQHVQPFMGAEIMSSLTLELEEVMQRARQFETVIIFPHPYCGSYTGIHNSYFPEERFEQLLSLADGVEVINSENLNKWNLRSALLGFNLNKGITGGSDGHRLSSDGAGRDGRRLRLEAPAVSGCGQAPQDSGHRQGNRYPPQDDLERNQAAFKHASLPGPGRKKPAIFKHHLAHAQGKCQAQSGRTPARPSPPGRRQMKKGRDAHPLSFAFTCL